MRTIFDEFVHFKSAEDSSCKLRIRAWTGLRSFVGSKLIACAMRRLTESFVCTSLTLRGLPSQSSQVVRIDFQGAAYL